MKEWWENPNISDAARPFNMNDGHIIIHITNIIINKVEILRVKGL